MPLDPVTAAFNFFCTPAGQKILDKFGGVLEGIVVDFAKLIHLKNVQPFLATDVQIK